MKKSRRRQLNQQSADDPTKKKKHHKTVLEVDVVTRHVSPPAAGVLQLMGTGMRLRVAHGNGEATVVDGFPNIPTGEHPKPSSLISEDIVTELIASGLLHKMARDRVQDRIGWAEAGLDGNAADFYSLVQ